MPLRENDKTNLLLLVNASATKSIHLGRGLFFSNYIHLGIHSNNLVRLLVSKISIQYPSGSLMNAIPFILPVKNIVKQISEFKKNMLN